MNIHGFDSLNICWIRTNHAWISDEWWEMNTLMCLFCESETFVLGLVLYTMNMMKMIEKFPEMCIWSFQSFPSVFACVCGYLNMYWSSWRSHGMLIGYYWFAWPRQFNEALRFAARRASVQMSTQFDSWLSQLFKMHFIIWFPSIPHSYMLLHVFLFFVSLHKFINNWYMIQKTWEFLHCFPYCV